MCSVSNAPVNNGRPGMDDKFTLKVTLDPIADPELYRLLKPVYPRRRAEYFRQLAKAGMDAGGTGSLSGNNTVAPNIDPLGHGMSGSTSMTTNL
jgi:hypothetical protein